MKPRFTLKKTALILSAVALVPMLLLAKAKGSDHADTPEIAASPGADLTDVYVFPSPTNPSNVVLAMNVHPLIMRGAGSSVSFDPNVLYQFKIDNTGDNVEDLVVQASFQGTGSSQKVYIAGPVKPSMTGAKSTLLSPFTTTGTINATFSPAAGMKVFAGAREDSFFFDLDQFFTILPDRAYPLTGVSVPDPNTPKAGSWRAPGVAKDFLSSNGYNVLSVVVELPKSQLIGSGDGKIHVWCTTSK